MNEAGLARGGPLGVALAVALALGASSAAADEYFTCRDASGRLLIQDTPCPGGTRTVSSKVLEAPARPAAPRDPAAAHPAGPARAPATAAPGASLVLDQPFEDPEWDEGMLGTMLLRARLAKVMASMSRLRTQVLMYYAERGTYPTRAEDMGLDSKTMSSDVIDDVWFGSDGAIVAELAESFGKDKRIALVPKEVLGGADTAWECAANFPAVVFGGPASEMCTSRVVRKPPGAK